MLLFLEIYLLFCLCCLILCVLIQKICDGYVTLNVLGELILISIIPGLNILLICISIGMIFDKHGNKKIL